MNCARQTSERTSHGLTCFVGKTRFLSIAREPGGTVCRMPPKKRNWIQEERRKTLGDWVTFCLGCGAVQRYFLELEAELPAVCPQCGGEMRHRCPECAAPFPSAFAVECEECGAAIRPPEVLGVRIRKPGR